MLCISWKEESCCRRQIEFNVSYGVSSIGSKQSLKRRMNYFALILVYGVTTVECLSIVERSVHGLAYDMCGSLSWPVRSNLKLFRGFAMTS